ncbi:hypothetical protein MMC08_008907, partial [Hypocenomyce scalaris]|nr:hypothetical protein [Hypocenomyce scalaris]
TINFFSLRRMTHFKQIARALTLRQRTFLEDPDWKSVPWMDDPTSKNSVQYLLDVLAGIPGLLEDEDRLLADQTTMSSADQDQLDSCRRRLIKILGELFLWRWGWERLHPNLAFEVVTDPATNITLDAKGTPIYRTILFYHDFQEGRAPLLYNTGLLILLCLAEAWDMQDAPHLALSTLSHQNPPILSSNPLVLPHAALAPAEVLCEICRSVEYFLQDSHLGAGSMQLLFPLRVALTCAQDGREKAWLTSIMRRMVKSGGFQMFERLVDHEPMALDLEKANSHSGSSPGE